MGGFFRTHCIWARSRRTNADTGKAEETAAVIQAAEASCQEKRDDLLAEIIADIIVRGSPGEAEDQGKRILSHLESE